MTVAISDGRGNSQNATTLEGGYFRIVNVRPGTYTASAQTGYGTSNPATFDVMPNRVANVNLIVPTAIDLKYSALGGGGGLLGQPLTNELLAPDGVGHFRHFQNGSIYWTPQTGAWEVQGAIRDKWASFGWERSFLGYPLTDESGTPDGVGRFNHFQGGSIYWTPQTGPHEVHGAIRDYWASLGWERSSLGYPITDEMPIQGSNGRYNQFQVCFIYWYPNTGAYGYCPPRIN